MSTNEQWFRGQLRDIPPQECMELLQARQLGRLAYSDADGPVILPLNYTVDGDDVLVATSAYSRLGRFGSIGPVAFEVDDVDYFNQSGWSVLVRGRAEVLQYDDLPPDVEDRPSPWVAGVRTMVIRITPREVTGRRVVPV